LLVYDLYIKNKFQEAICRQCHNQHYILLLFIFMFIIYIIISFRISKKYIQNVRTKFLKTSDNTNKDHSILEKLLLIDEQTAHVMALDILMSTDTVTMWILI